MPEWRAAHSEAIRARFAAIGILYNPRIVTVLGLVGGAPGGETPIAYSALAACKTLGILASKQTLGLGFIVASGPVGRQCEAQRVASQPFRAGYDVALRVNTLSFGRTHANATDR